MSGAFSYYDLLGVESSATQSEINSAYRSSLLRYHPDINSAPNATHLTAILNEAYRVLSATASRAAYDASFASRPATGLSRRQPSRVGGALYGALFFPWLFAWQMAVARR
ncbi:MAG: J domain-containing protein [Candidatus Velthaea sp.]|jgi:DnaJ-class molecular chaperone